VPLMDDDAIDVPLRTRGAIRLREPQSRILVRTHGRPQPRPSGAPAPLTLHQVLQQLREDVDQMPLVVVAFGGTGRSLGELMAHLAPELYADDAVWIAGTDQATGPALASCGLDVVRLDPARDADARVLSNLVADILFCPAEMPDELERLPRWALRARALIVAGASRLSRKLLDGGCAMKMRTFRWPGGNRVIEL
jgi:hypothetical protein